MLLSQQVSFVLPLYITCSGHSDILEHLNVQFWKSKPKHLAFIDKTDKIIVVDGSASVNFNIKYHNGMNFAKNVTASQTVFKFLLYQNMLIL